jgi:predicted TIM-barrel fold metal-dependent hydrolase
MGRVVDADSHWTFAWEFELEEGPLRRFAPHLGSTAGLLSFFMAADLIRSLPAGEKPDPEDLFPPQVLPGGVVKKIPPHWEKLKVKLDAGDRVAWMDRVGIDYALVNPGGYAALYPLFDDLAVRRGYLRECNDLLADDLERCNDRLGAISAVDLTDMDWAIGEITRMRARGSRSFVVRTEAVNGFSPGHSHWDRLWAAAVDLGMVVTLHIGNAPTQFGDFGRIDWKSLGPNWRGAFLRMANCQPNQGAELFLNALLYGGVFERHPKLTVLVAELWTGWLPNFIRKAEVLTAKGGPWGEWPFPLGGGDYLRRNVRITPLPGLGDWNALELVETYPEIMVFSSDYPHTEGNADPINLYQPGLDRLAPRVRESFLGENLADCFDRTGDPVLAA